jgi:hypothetical protein
MSVAPAAAARECARTPRKAGRRRQAMDADTRRVRRLTMNEDAASCPTAARRLTPANVHEASPLLARARSDLADLHITGSDAVRACHHLLVSGAMMGVLVDLFEPNAPRRVVGVGGGAFVSRRFIESERAHPRPGLTERVLASVLACRSVALTRRQMAAANAGEGLSLAVVLHHWQHGIPDALQREVRRHLMEKFLQDVRGFRMREVVAEACDDIELRWGLAGGFRLRSQPLGAQPGEPAPIRRSIIGITRDEALASEGSALSLLFHYSPPRFRFTPSQRRLLMEAIHPKTDVEIARALDVSLSAVKKAWAEVFRKSGAILDSDGDGAAAQSARMTRGAQKRHVLLTYLREHPEELRP